MAIESPTFGVKLGNVPIVNLRWEFRVHFRMAKEERLIPLPTEGRPMQTPYMIWLGADINAGITLLFSRTVLSLEAYMSYAAEVAGAYQGMFSPEFRARARDPFPLGRGTANAYYNKLPELLDPNLPMRLSAPATWASTRLLYSEIRNPIFHGHQLMEVSSAQLANLFEQVGKVYRWIDSWFDPELTLPGARKSFAFD